MEEEEFAEGDGEGEVEGEQEDEEQDYDQDTILPAGINCGECERPCAFPRPRGCTHACSIGNCIYYNLVPSLEYERFPLAISVSGLSEITTWL